MPIAVKTRTPPTAIASSSTGSSSSASQSLDGDAGLMRVEAPICPGTGSDLPGLFGLRTIEEEEESKKTPGEKLSSPSLELEDTR